MAKNAINDAFDQVEKETPSTDITNIDLTSIETIKDSLYSIAYNRAIVNGSRGNHALLSTNNASVLQALDLPGGKKDYSKRGYGPNPLNKYFICVKASKNGDGTWYRYDGSVWIEESTDIAEAIVHNVTSGVYNAYLQMVSDGTLDKQTNGDEKAAAKKGKLITEYRNFKENTVPVKNTITFVTNALKRSDDPFTESRYLVMRNGDVLDTDASSEQGEAVFIKPSPELLIHERYRTTFDYTPGQSPGAALEHWLRTSPIDYETGVNLVRALSCAVFSPKPKKFFSLIEMYGESNTGKSALLESMFKLSVPGLVAPANEAQFGKNPNNFAIGRIIGKRILMLTEYSSEFSESQVKTVTGGDTIMADIKFKEPREFVFNGVLAITTNSSQGTDLNVRDSGMRERIFPVQFPRSVLGKEVVTPDGITPAWDGPDLKLTALPAENDQNMSWAIDLWIEWEQKDTFRIPHTPAQSDQVEQRQDDADSISVRLEEGAQDGLWRKAHEDTPTKYLLKFSTFWPSYQAWTKRAFGKAPGRNTVRSEMSDRGMIVQYNNAYFITGYTTDSTWALAFDRADGDGDLTRGL